MIHPTHSDAFFSKRTYQLAIILDAPLKIIVESFDFLTVYVVWARHWNPMWGKLGFHCVKGGGAWMLTLSCPKSQSVLGRNCPVLGQERSVLGHFLLRADFRKVSLSCPRTGVS